VTGSVEIAALWFGLSEILVDCDCSMG
jgi:hypothetical protein